MRDTAGGVCLLDLGAADTENDEDGFLVYAFEKSFPFGLRLKVVTVGARITPLDGGPYNRRRSTDKYAIQKLGVHCTSFQTVLRNFDDSNGGWKLQSSAVLSVTECTPPTVHLRSLVQALRDEESDATKEGSVGKLRHLNEKGNIVRPPQASHHKVL
jgi:hypothetical protein